MQSFPPEPLRNCYILGFVAGFGQQMSETYEVPDDLHYTKDHEWARLEKKYVAVGITDYAQKRLHEIIYVDMPTANQKVKQREVISTVESVKATSDIFAPISGRIVETNSKLLDQPELLNDSPYGDGWIARIEMSDPEELEKLMDSDEYRRYIEELEEETEEEEQS